MKMPGLSEILDDLVNKRVREMIKTDEGFAKRIRRLIDYTYGDVQEGAFKEIEDTCGHEN